LELRILKRLGKRARRRKSCGARATDLQRLGEELQQEDKSSEEEGDWLVCDENMEKGSISLARR
jgi:hypothetical protein